MIAVVISCLLVCPHIHLRIMASWPHQHSGLTLPTSAKPV